MAKKKTVRKVRTAAGVKRFGAPIGTPIVADPITGKLKAVTKGVARLDGGGKSESKSDAPSKNLAGQSRSAKKALNTEPKAGTPDKTVAERAKGSKPAATRTANKAATEARSRMKTKERRMSLGDKKGKAKESMARAKVVRGPGPWDPEDNFEKRGEWVDKVIGQMMKSGKTTDAVHKKPRYDGEGNRSVQYTPERRKLQNDLLNEMWSRNNADKVPRERKALFTGGAGGSGKGFVLKTAGIKEGEDYVTVNADDFKELMAEKGLIPVPEGMSQLEGVALVHEESSDLSAMFAARLQAEGVNMIWDITMGSPGQVHKRLDLLEKNGYKDIRGMYVDVPIERSVANAKKRYAGGMKKFADGKDGKGGRRVPPSVIMENVTDTPGITKNRMSFDAVRDRFTVAERWDNNRRDKDGNPLPPKVVG